MALPGESEQPQPDPQGKPGRVERLRRGVRRHPVRALFGLIGVCLLAVMAIFLWGYLQSYEETDDAQIDGHISSLSARVEGTVIAVHVEDNQEVQAGQLLVELDPRDYQIALERAEAQLAQAEAQVEAAKLNVPVISTSNQTRIVTTMEDVSDVRAALAAAARNHRAALAQLREAQANNEKAQTDVRRYRYLAAEDAVPIERYEVAVTAAGAASASVDARRATARAAAQAIEQQKARVAQSVSRQSEASRTAPEEIAIQHANVVSARANALAARANLDLAKLNLAYTRILAPVAGVVGKRTVEVGARVQPGQSLLAIVDVAHVWVTANFKETQLQHIHRGQSARIHVDAFDRDYRGAVEEGLPGASGARFSLFPPENATGNYVKVVQRLPVRICIKTGQDRAHRLRPGMSAEPKVWLK